MPDQQPTPAVPATEQAIASEPPAMPSPTAPSASPVVAPSPVIRRSGNARLLNVALAGALVLAVAGVAFAVGRFTAPSTVSAGNFPDGGGFIRNGQGGQNGRAGFLAGGGLTIEGTVESIDASTLTLKTASGQTIQIALDGSTTYHAQSDASASDVTAGGKVLVRLDARGGFAGGPQSTGGPGDGTATSPAASDVTVVP